MPLFLETRKYHPEQQSYWSAPPLWKIVLLSYQSSCDCVSLQVVTVCTIMMIIIHNNNENCSGETVLSLGPAFYTRRFYESQYNPCFIGGRNERTPKKRPAP